MRQIQAILALIFLLAGCNQNNSTISNKQNEDTGSNDTHVDNLKKSKQEAMPKRLSFQKIEEIVADSSRSTWVKLNGDAASLALHFQNNDTLAVSYSAECWLMYPYKLDNNKIVVYWDKNVDTKYNFDIVTAIDKTDKKLIGSPFMILKLENDTTLKATYLMKDLVEIINRSGKEGRTFFPDKYIISQEYLY